MSCRKVDFQAVKGKYRGHYKGERVRIFAGNLAKGGGVWADGLGGREGCRADIGGGMSCGETDRPS